MCSLFKKKNLIFFVISFLLGSFFYILNSDFQLKKKIESFLKNQSIQHSAEEYSLEEHLERKKHLNDLKDIEERINVKDVEENKALEDRVLKSLIKSYESVAKIMQTPLVNQFKVNYRGPKLEFLPSAKELICEIINNIQPLVYHKGNDGFFKEEKLDTFFPEEEFMKNKRYKNCAVVMNSGAMYGSKHGQFIDEHDFVLRFNHAPTEGFEEDVGRKTSLRIVNSLILKHSRYNFSHPLNNFYTKDRTLIFELSLYNDTTKSWFHNQEKKFFDNYFKRRKMNPDAKMYLLNTKFIWNIWNWLSSKFKLPLLNRIPTSGFIGIFSIIGHCDKLRVFEYIPSKRESLKCHYFETKEGTGCTYSGGHPISAEKLISYIMSHSSRNEIFSKGYLTIDTTHCKESPLSV